jgi:protein-S-isoprenylcysteine O-methyltransferase Ste14
MEGMLSVVGLVAMIFGLVGLYYVHALFSANPVVIGVQLAAVGLMIWARITFGRRSFHATADPTAGGLVTWGPYRFIRHPIYTAACLIVAASAISHPSVRSAALGLLAFAGAGLRMLAEERMVTSRYPEYRAYAAKTRRMVPYVF